MIILEMLAVLFLAAILEMTEIEVARIPSFFKMCHVRGSGWGIMISE